MSAVTGGLGVVVLAAGQGTRMKSALPKVLHPICGRSMIRHLLATVSELHPARVAVVVGHGGAQVREHLAGTDVLFVEQTELLGTADAVRRAREAMSGCERVLVLNGDCPLVTTETLAALLAASGRSPVVLLSSMAAEPGKLGRLLRDGNGHIERIVEASDYEGPAGAAEINAGQYSFDGAWLWERIDAIPVSAKGEYYLTHLVEMAYAERRAAVSVLAEREEILGVDDRVLLAEAEGILRQRILRTHMQAGVTIQDPATTFIGAEVVMEPDVTVLAGCHLQGETRIGQGSTVGPNSMLVSAEIGRDVRVTSSVIEHSKIGDRTAVGPFAHVRGGAVIGEDCELGNYAEVKNSILGNGVKMHHFSYMGDATVGAGSNIAAGVITCNYDGVHKHRTEIGEQVFVGCDTMLVAPVSLGDGAVTGAGAVVTKDVAAGQRVAGVPARPLPPKEARD
jgi:bifunctional UDP-N-acetylglucosamine pyrophosphorylase / glucosamine-1-phosphate N-acetyltransferase